MNDRCDLQRSINARITPHIPARAWDSTVAVVVAVPPNVYQLGSATLFQIADLRLVVTAAHVVQGASDAGKTVGISGGADGHFVAVAGDWVRSAASDHLCTPGCAGSQHAVVQDQVDPRPWGQHSSLETVLQEAGGQGCSSRDREYKAA